MSNRSMSNIYRITFINHGKTYEIYAKSISHGATLYGFIEVNELIFGSTSSLVVDPAEEKLKSEFNGVKKTYIPLHSIIRIDEVEKEGVAKIKEGSTDSGNVHQFPMPVYTPDPSTT